MPKSKRVPLATKVYSPVEWEKRRKRQKRKDRESEARKDLMRKLINNAG